MNINVRALRVFVATLSMTSPVFLGCYAGTTSPYDGTSGDGGPGGAPSVTGTPCEVSDMLTQYCVRCHSGSSISASDLPLTSYDALVAASGGGTVAEKALAKIGDARKPMPPRGEPAPSAQEVAAFSDWIAAGYAPGECAGSTVDAGGPSPYDTPVMCTSGTRWTGGNEESPKMHPGRACISCHTAEGEGPRFDFAGTLYASAHEPDDCNGEALATRLIITDATGAELALTPNSVGNFSARNSNLVLPYTARLENADGVRAMVTEQSDGDCNGCHTELGKHRAPGRIMAP